MPALTWLAFAERCTQLPAKVEARLPALTLEAAEAAAVIHRGVLDRHTRGRRLRGVGRSGARLDVVARPGIIRGVAIVAAVGPMHLIERSTRAHTVAPRRKLAMRIGGRFVSGSIQVRGTQGRHVFAEGFVAAEPVVARILATGAVESVVEGLR